MAVKEKKIIKLYYTISELADLLCVSTSTLRWYQEVFNIRIPIKGRGKGQRIYNLKAVEKFKHIFSLLRNDGYTIKGALKQYNLTKETNEK